MKEEEFIMIPLRDECLSMDTNGIGLLPGNIETDKILIASSILENDILFYLLISMRGQLWDAFLQKDDSE